MDIGGDLIGNKEQYLNTNAILKKSIDYGDSDYALASQSHWSSYSVIVYRGIKYRYVVEELVSKEIES